MGLTNGTVASDKMEKVAISRECVLIPNANMLLMPLIGQN